MERVAGIEPASSAWKAEVLPLNHTRIPLSQPFADTYLRRLSAIKMVVGEGFEPSKA
jgi:hypothetical protein